MTQVPVNRIVSNRCRLPGHAPVHCFRFIRFTLKGREECFESKHSLIPPSQHSIRSECFESFRMNRINETKGREVPLSRLSAWPKKAIPASRVSLGHASRMDEMTALRAIECNWRCNLVRIASADSRKFRLGAASSTRVSETGAIKKAALPRRTSHVRERCNGWASRWHR